MSNDSSFTPETDLQIPQGAPRRPYESSWLLYGLLLAFFITVGISGLEAPTPFYSLGVLPIAIAWGLWFFRRYRYDRIGWYVRKDVSVPNLPHRISGRGQTVVFRDEDLTISALLRPTKTISYSNIFDVQIDCDESGLYLNGVILLASSKTHSNDLTAPLTIYDTGSGEQTRTTFAILRAKAPRAMFTSIPWIEEGWVPRSGFKRPIESNDTCGD